MPSVRLCSSTSWKPGSSAASACPSRTPHVNFAWLPSINYLLQDVDAAAFFQSAWDAIKPGGGLFFDVSTPYKLEHLLGSQFMGEDRRDVTYMWQNRYFPERQQVEMHLAIFVKEPDGRYRRIDEEQVQRAYQAEKLVALLQSIGFVDVRVFGTNALTHPSPEEHRWHIAARKPE